MLNFFDLFVNNKNQGRHLKKGVDESDNPKRGKEFSKILLVQESLLIWIHTLAMLILAYICVFKGSWAEFPWLTAMAALPWGAYAVSQHAYYKKAQAENTEGGIIFETAKWDEDAVG